LNKNHKISITDFHNIPHNKFLINNDITKKYNKLSFDEFFNEFTEKSKFRKDKREINKKKCTNYQDLMSVCYYLYLNGYQFDFDDIGGIYYVSKRDVFLKSL
jgi:hypothetical protein